MNVDYPFKFDERGRTATTSDSDHIRDLVEQVLFTAPGERVNRPDFGSGLLQLVFAPGGEALASATEMSVQGALQQWLGELIEVDAVSVGQQESRLEVTVRYTVRSSGELRKEVFSRNV